MSVRSGRPLTAEQAALPGAGLTRTSFTGLRSRTSRVATSMLANGEPMLWLTGGGLILCLVMIVGLLALVFYNGFTTFWPRPLLQIETRAGRTYLGEVTRTSTFAPQAGFLDSLTPAEAAAARAELARQEDDSELHRRLLRTGNFDITGEHFNWISSYEIATNGQSAPRWALLLERLASGRFHGFPAAFLVDGEAVATEPEPVWKVYRRYHPQVRARFHERRKLETVDVGRINHDLEEARLAARSAALEHGEDSPEYRRAAARQERVAAQAGEKFAAVEQRIAELNAENDRYVLRMRTAQGEEKDIPLAEVVRAFPPNQLSLAGKAGVYLARWWEFLTAEPREANSEGGVFPAIFGTVVMTLIMTHPVVPFGVLAALYLREYARPGALVERRPHRHQQPGRRAEHRVRRVRAGVLLLHHRRHHRSRCSSRPSCRIPTFGTGGLLWASLTLALLTLPVVIVATEEALAAVPGSMREG